MNGGEHLIVMKPSDLDRMVAELKSKLIDEMQAVKGLVIEKPMCRKEAAKFLAIDVSTLHVRIKKGIIPAKLIHYNGNKPYFLPSELHQFIKQS